MVSKCYAIKKDGELCNVILTEKNRNKIKIENKSFFVCGRHKKVDNINKIDISKYKGTDNIKSIEEDFSKKIKLNDNNDNINSFYLNKDIQYPFTMPIMCFTCNTVISKVNIFNKLWNIYNKNINDKIEFINEIIKYENIEEIKWKKIVNDNWWQKIGGFEKIRDGIEIDFTINETEWKNIGIENICCKRMIYTHQENPLFVYGPSDY